MKQVVGGSGKREGKIWAGFPPEFVARIKTAYPGEEFLHQALDDDDLELTMNWFSPKMSPEFRNFTPEQIVGFMGTEMGAEELKKQAEEHFRLKKLYEEFYHKFYKPIKDGQGLINYAAS